VVKLFARAAASSAHLTLARCKIVHDAISQPSILGVDKLSIFLFVSRILMRFQYCVSTLILNTSQIYISIMIGFMEMVLVSFHTVLLSSGEVVI
jgi:hypothetical protein